TVVDNPASSEMAPQRRRAPGGVDEKCGRQGTQRLPVPASSQPPSAGGLPVAAAHLGSSADNGASLRGGGGEHVIETHSIDPPSRSIRIDDEVVGVGLGLAPRRGDAGRGCVAATTKAAPYPEALEEQSDIRRQGLPDAS